MRAEPCGRFAGSSSQPVPVKETDLMHSIFYIIGVVVVVLVAINLIM